ncbi:MAG: tyrosine-type recombinase/integrase [Candidatus Peregrinibacteria bacterium]
MTRSEITRLLSKIRLSQHRLIVALAYAAGLCAKEMVNLRLKDIDLEKGVIHVWGRTTILPNKLRIELWQLAKDKAPEAFIFSREHGIPFSVRNVQIMFKRALKRAMITKPATFKSLRDSFGVHLLEDGISMEYVKKLLGHKNLKTTKRYQQFASQDFPKISSPMEQIRWVNDYRPGRF